LTIRNAEEVRVDLDAAQRLPVPFNCVPAGQRLAEWGLMPVGRAAAIDLPRQREDDAGVRRDAAVQ
jgi:hypothetical protein